MDIQERYDELDNIESTLRILIDEITDRDYIEQLQETMFQAQNEKEELEEQLQDQYDREERKQNYEYEKSKF
jgi:predicted  nucleic acid-binding Zn-ribbon protein